jgi:hypothetical protein
MRHFPARASRNSARSTIAPAAAGDPSATVGVWILLPAHRISAGTAQWSTRRFSCVRLGWGCGSCAVRNRPITSNRRTIEGSQTSAAFCACRAISRPLCRRCGSEVHVIASRQFPWGRMTDCGSENQRARYLLCGGANSGLAKIRCAPDGTDVASGRDVEVALSCEC